MLSSSHDDVLTCCESVHASELDWCEVWTTVCWCIDVSCCQWRDRVDDWCNLWLTTIPIQLLKLQLLLPWFVASTSCSSLVIGRSRWCRTRGWRRWRARRVVEGTDSWMRIRRVVIEHPRVIITIGCSIATLLHLIILKHESVPSTTLLALHRLHPLLRHPLLLLMTKELHTYGIMI